MKVSPKDLETLRAAIEPEDTEPRREAYRSGNIPRNDYVQDINKRYRWDLYWHAARIHNGLPDSTSGYNMGHIDTALRSIVKPL